MHDGFYSGYKILLKNLEDSIQINIFICIKIITEIKVVNTLLLVSTVNSQAESSNKHEYAQWNDIVTGH